jgi:hypothetical protein
VKKYLVIFNVHASASAEVKAESREEAEEKAARKVHPSVCHQCARDVQIGDVGEVVDMIELEE